MNTGTKVALGVGGVAVVGGVVWWLAARKSAAERAEAKLVPIILKWMSSVGPGEIAARNIAEAQRQAVTIVSGLSQSDSAATFKRLMARGDLHPDIVESVFIGARTQAGIHGVPQLLGARR